MPPDLSEVKTESGCHTVPEGDEEGRAEAGLLSPEEWKSLFSGKGIALPDGRMLMAVKEPAGYGLKITAPTLRSIKTAEMEI